jgi:hypothetical protein
MEFEEIPDFPACCQRERFPKKGQFPERIWLWGVTPARSL